MYLSHDSLLNLFVSSLSFFRLELALRVEFVFLSLTVWQSLFFSVFHGLFLMPKVIYLLRHGEAKHNLYDTGPGSYERRRDPALVDPPLTEKGVSQVQAARQQIEAAPCLQLVMLSTGFIVQFQSSRLWPYIILHRLICLNIMTHMTLCFTFVYSNPFAVVWFWASFNLFATIVTLMPRCSRRMEMPALMRLWVLHFAEH